jgi:hypothetical protein
MNPQENHSKMTNRDLRRTATPTYAGANIFRRLEVDVDFPSLPQYPMRQQSAAAKLAPRPGIKRSPQLTNVFLGLALLAALLAATVTLPFIWRTVGAINPPPAPSPQAPLDFKLIKKRFHKVHILATRQEVEELLGPPSPEAADEPQLQSIDAVVEAHPDRYEIYGGEVKFRCWLKWTDPTDKGRWVAVLFVGDKAFHLLKKGF